MRIPAPILSFIMLLVAVWPAHGQKEGHDGASVRMIEFMVRNGYNIRDIAARTKIPVRQILKANKLHSGFYLAYPGRRLYLPVPVQPKIWDPTREDMTGNSPSRQDRGNAEDFELVIDSSNYSLSEDFINVSEARSDSVEYENIGVHIRKIEKRIGILNYRIDSLKEADFRFDNDDQDKNSVMGKLKIARDKYYAESPIGKQIDSLQALKLWLGQRRIILSNQISDYEYLADNASYAAKNYQHEEKGKSTNWGDHLAYESNYVKDKSAGQSKPAPVVSATTAEKPIAIAREEKASGKGENIQTDPEPAPAPAKASANIPPEPPKTSPAVSLPPDTAETEDAKMQDNAASDEIFPHYMSDFSLLPKKIFSTEIYASRARVLILLNPDTMGISARRFHIAAGSADGQANPAAGASKVYMSPGTDEKQPEKSGIEEAKTIAPAAISDDPGHKLHAYVDTLAEKAAPKVSTDPLAHYKTDSGFISNPVPIKAIPVPEYKNKPKYLVPVDSLSRTKGDFLLLKARQELEKGDFKSGDKSLRKSLDIDPNNAQAWMLHADLFLSMGLADQALKEYTIAGEIDSTNPKVFYNIALLYNKANDHQKAYKYFTRAIEVNEKYLLAYMGRASLQMDERDYQGAIEDYDKVLAANKYYSPAFKARGLAKMELRKFAEAIQDFNQYLDIEDPDGFVLFQRGISKIYSDNLLQGCLDLSSAHELGFKEAEKAIRKFCE